MAEITGEYKTRGEYHKKLDQKWKIYYPVYLAKMEFVKNFLNKTPKNKKILDMGCGEGVLVQEYSKKGYDIKGIDLNYKSKFVTKGDIRKTNYKKTSFDIILCLDVIEHLNFDEQELVIKEIDRILKKGGALLISIPNLAHFASRLSFMFTGKLIRTSKIERHKGDRPIGEYLEILKKHFNVKIRKGIFPTLPISTLMSYYFPNRVLFLHKILNLFLAYPNWCFLNILVCRKK